MDTGEGKTLTATLAAATAALSGQPVHIVTVNDYLAARDAAAMRPLYEALKAAGVLVRFFDKPGLSDTLRISIGTSEETDTLLGAIDRTRQSS